MSKQEIPLTLDNDFTLPDKEAYCKSCVWCVQVQNFFDYNALNINPPAVMQCHIVNEEHVVVNAWAILKKPIRIENDFVQVKLFAFMNTKVACPALASGNEPEHDHLKSI